MDSLLYRELMSDDQFSHHKVGAETGYSYNNRLHIGATKSTFFNGFDESYFNRQQDYNGISSEIGDVDYIVTETEFHLGASLKKVYATYDTGFGVNKLFTSAFLSYPDPRAKRMTFYEIKNGVWTKVFTAQLREHRFLNLAYYLNGGLNPIKSDENVEIVPPIDTNTVATLIEPNSIKVSELSNPLKFPNKNVYKVSGQIMAMATNAMNVFDRNYGQFPLYVFTTQGIWTLNVGSGEVVYSTLSAPTYGEAPTTPIVCSVPFGVVFTSRRGLMLINGQSVDFISPQIEQIPAKLNIEMNSHCDGVVFAPEQKKFSELLMNLSDIAYMKETKAESELLTELLEYIDAQKKV